MHFLLPPSCGGGVQGLDRGGQGGLPGSTTRLASAWGEGKRGGGGGGRVGRSAGRLGKRLLLLLLLGRICRLVWVVGVGVLWPVAPMVPPPPAAARARTFPTPPTPLLHQMLLHHMMRGPQWFEKRRRLFVVLLRFTSPRRFPLASSAVVSRAGRERRGGQGGHPHKGWLSWGEKRRWRGAVAWMRDPTTPQAIALRPPASTAATVFPFRLLQSIWTLSMGFAAVHTSHQLRRRDEVGQQDRGGGRGRGGGGGAASSSPSIRRVQRGRGELRPTRLRTRAGVGVVLRTHLSPKWSFSALPAMPQMGRVQGRADGSCEG